VRKQLLIASLIVACAVVAQASQTRTLDGTAPAADLQRVVLEAGVGDVEIIPSDGDAVRYEVLLKPRRGGFFSSMKRAEREVQEAVLESEVVGQSLHLMIESEDEERRFEERWTIEMPARLAIEMDLGVGDVEIRGLEGGVEIEAGVGDLLIDVACGSISVEAGVGDVTVTAPADSYGDVECSAGVGDARIRIRGERISSEGFVGHSAEWTGNGPHEVTVEVGVGDVRVTLD
jgi:hypothetical protein